MTTPSLNSTPVIPAKQRAMIFASFVFVLLATCIWTNGGHPRSNWIYPFSIALAALGALRIFHLGDRPFGVGDLEPKTGPEAVARASVMFAAFVCVAYAFWALLSTEPFSWAAAVAIGGMAAVNVYRQKRGYAFSSWPGVIVMFGLLFSVIFLQWLGVIPRSHF